MFSHGGLVVLRCLQNMLLEEEQNKVHTNPNSASVATLWLSRGLRFIGALLEEVLVLYGIKDGVVIDVDKLDRSAVSEDLTGAVTAAYARSLRLHHSWVVRGVVAVSSLVSGAPPPGDCVCVCVFLSAVGDQILALSD